jgi:ligand-binding sensor domain-containing protein
VGVWVGTAKGAKMREKRERVGGVGRNRERGENTLKNRAGGVWVGTAKGAKMTLKIEGRWVCGEEPRKGRKCAEKRAG